MELLIILSFLLAICWISDGSLDDLSPFQTFSVSLDPKDCIIVTRSVTNAKGKYIIFKKQIYLRIAPLYINTRNWKMSHAGCWYETADRKSFELLRLKRVKRIDDSPPTAKQYP